MSVNSAVCSSRCNCVNLEFVSCMRKFRIYLCTEYNKNKTKNHKKSSVWCFDAYAWNELWFVVFFYFLLELAWRQTSVGETSNGYNERHQATIKQHQIKVHCSSFAIIQTAVVSKRAWAEHTAQLDLTWLEEHDVDNIVVSLSTLYYFSSIKQSWSIIAFINFDTHFERLFFLNRIWFGFVENEWLCDTVKTPTEIIKTINCYCY